MSGNTKETGLDSYYDITGRQDQFEGTVKSDYSSNISELTDDLLLWGKNDSSNVSSPLRDRIQDTESLKYHVKPFGVSRDMPQTFPIYMDDKTELASLKKVIMEMKEREDKTQEIIRNLSEKFEERQASMIEMKDSMKEMENSMREMKVIDDKREEFMREIKVTGDKNQATINELKLTCDNNQAIINQLIARDNERNVMTVQLANKYNEMEKYVVQIRKNYGIIQHNMTETRKREEDFKTEIRNKDANRQILIDEMKEKDANRQMLIDDMKEREDHRHVFIKKKEEEMQVATIEMEKKLEDLKTSITILARHSPPLQQNNSLPELMAHFNQYNLEGTTWQETDSKFEMFLSGHCPEWPTSDDNSQWRLNGYSQMLIGELLSSEGFKMDGKTGMVSCEKRRYVLCCYLEVRQRGVGSMNWYLCTDKEPIKVYKGGAFEIRESVDKGQIHCFKVLTTGQGNRIDHSHVVGCDYLPHAHVWVEVEKTSGDPVVGECRLYGGWNLR